jgi:hypothetical protein
MPNPFSGMNPYLEQPEFWSDFHNQLIVSLARVLIPTLLPNYRVIISKWVYSGFQFYEVQFFDYLSLVIRHW